MRPDRRQRQALPPLRHDAADAIDAAATALLAVAVTIDALAVAWLDPRRLCGGAAEVRLRTLARVLLAIGGERLSAALRAARGARSRPWRTATGRFKRTLAGAVVERRGGRFAFYREAGATGLPTVAVKAGFAGVWDHRFADRDRGRRAAGCDARRRSARRAGARSASVPATRPAGALAALAGAPPAGGGPGGSVALLVAAGAGRLHRHGPGADRRAAATPPRFPDLASRRRSSRIHSAVISA